MVVQNVEIHDTLREVTTITVDRNDRGDTLRQSIVTDRYRGRDAAQLKDKSEKVVVRTDTVYVAIRDSTSVSRFKMQDSCALSHQTSSISHLLKWRCFIILGLIALIITVKGRCR